MQVETEQLPKGFTVYDVMGKMVSVAGFQENGLEEQIIKTRRDNPTYTDDATIGLMLIWQTMVGNPKLRSTLEQQGIKPNYLSIKQGFFPGLEIDSRSANLPRSEENQRLDEEARKRWEKGVEANKAAMDSINNSQK